MRKLIIVLFLLFPFVLSAHLVGVRILSTMSVSSVNVSVSAGKYLLYLDGKLQLDSIATKVFQLVKVNDSIEVRVPGDTIGRFVSFQLIAMEDSSVFKIKPIKPISGTRIYDHSLLVTVVNGFFQCLNNVELDHYVAGVVESEAGGRTTKEFYKVQAILCRTYALAHLYRHATEGFEVCDAVHCQVYKGRPSDRNVLAAVEETEGLVVVDRSLILITPVFFSNCGGQTANSEDVWAVPVPYLRSVKDTFCIHSTCATWTRKILREDWLNYLETKHKYPINDSLACYKALNMTQGYRTPNYSYNGTRIPYKTIRSDWGLRSAYFSIAEAKDSIVIRGRGYGHGVGLCQEGAIKMAKLGYSYEWILHYYYKNIDIINLSKLEFFKED